MFTSRKVLDSWLISFVKTPPVSDDDFNGLNQSRGASDQLPALLQ
jgi:hypothetical protein